MASLALTGEDYAFSRLISYAAYQWPGYSDAPHHRLIARHLEAVERGEITRLMITMPPRHGKSMLASEFFPAWYMGRNPDHYVVTATYAQELADDFGRKVKNQIEDAAFATIFPGVGLADDSKSAKRFHIEGGAFGGYEHTTKQRGAFYAVGVGGPLTGRGAHLLLIDDPVKNREDAESEVIRKKTKDWYTSTAYTRLMPGGRIVVIQCMTGDTEILRPDGSLTPLRDIRCGDGVATYCDGRLSKSKVSNWSSNGLDNVFEIKTSSGITAKANERHPFLVRVGDGLEWIRLRDLRPGHEICRVSGESGKAKCALGVDAKSLLDRGATAVRTTIKSAGRMVLGRLPSIPLLGAPLVLNTAMASLLKNMIGCVPNRAGCAQSASILRAPMSEHIGVGSSASIIATKAATLERFFAMIAILPQVISKPLKRLMRSPHISDFTFDRIEEIKFVGREEVFDVEIAETGNFIANDLVSHNTRWHEDDLAGWLQEEHAHEGWAVLNLPAINDDGEALWPEQYPVEALERIKKALPPRDWSALYQQRPSPETGDYFKREWIIPVDVIPPKEAMAIYGGSDYAVTADGGDYTVHAVIGLSPDGRMYLLDLWRAQASSDIWVEAFCDLVRKWKPIGWAEETGQIKSGVGPFLIKRMIETESFVAREQFPTRGDKAIRAQSIRGRMAMQGLHIHKDAPFLSDFISELMSFPVGVHDDQVDSIGLVGQLMDRMDRGTLPKSEQPVIPRGAIRVPSLPTRLR